MDEQQLIDTLDRLVGDVPVGPPPTRASLSGGRRRFRSYAVVAGAAVAVLAVAVTGAVVRSDRTASDPRPADRIVEPPVGTVWVGRGHAAMAVPDDWTRDQVDCDTPEPFTVMTHVVRGGLLCSRDQLGGSTYASVLGGADLGHLLGVLADSPGIGRPAATEVEVDGVDGMRTVTACRATRMTNERSCEATLVLRSEGVAFTVVSTISAQAVDDLLDTIRVLPDQVAVPSTFDANELEGYTDLLDRQGFTPDVVDFTLPGEPVARLIDDVTPAPGTMVAPRSTVRVLPRGLRGGELRISYDGLDGRAVITDRPDRQTIDMPVGGILDLSYDAGGSQQVVGPSLIGSFERIGPHSWRMTDVGTVSLSSMVAPCLPGTGCTPAPLLDLTIRVVDPSASPGSSSDAFVDPSPGTVWVGRGHAAIAVPKDWDIDPTCGQRGASLTSSAFVDASFGRLSCLQPGPAGAFVVISDPFVSDAPSSGRTTEVDGVAAVRDSECVHELGGEQRVTGCSGSMRIDSEFAYFVVMAPSAQAVDDLLDSIRVLPAQVAVPSVGRRETVETYQAKLQELGLDSAVGPLRASGSAVDPDPAPGTLVAVGSSVRP